MSENIFDDFIASARDRARDAREVEAIAREKIVLASGVMERAGYMNAYAFGAWSASAIFHLRWAQQLWFQAAISVIALMYVADEQERVAPRSVASTCEIKDCPSCEDARRKEAARQKWRRGLH